MELFGSSSLGNYGLWIDAGGFFSSMMQPQVTPPYFKGLPHPCSHGWLWLNATGHTTEKVMSPGNRPAGEKNSIDRGVSDHNEPYTCMSKNKCHKIILLRIRDLVLSGGIKFTTSAFWQCMPNQVWARGNDSLNSSFYIKHTFLSCCLWNNDPVSSLKYFHMQKF